MMSSISGVGRDELFSTIASLKETRSKIRDAHPRLVDALRNLTFATTIADINEYVSDACKPQYQRRFFGLIRPKSPPPTPPSRIFDLPSPEAIHAFKSIASELKSKRQETLDAKIKASGGTIKAARGAANLLVSHFDLTSLPDNAADVVEGIVEIWASSISNNDDSNFLNGNLQRVANKADFDARAEALKFINLAVDFVSAIRKASQRTHSLETTWRQHLAELPPSQESSSYKVAVADYSRNRFYANAILEIVENRISKIDFFGNSILSFAASEVPDVSHAHPLGHPFVGKSRLTDAYLFTRNPEIASTIVRALDLSLADAIEQKLQMDIKFARERRSEDRRIGPRNGGSFSWVLSCYENDPTDELKCALGQSNSRPGLEFPVHRSSAKIHHLREEVEMFKDRVLIHKLRNPEFSDNKLNKSLSLCSDALEVARQYGKYAEVALPTNPTHKNFEVLSKQIKQSQGHEPPQDTCRADLIPSMPPTP